MNRRNFIKSGALFVPAFGIFVPKLIRAQAFSPSDVAFTRKIEAAAGGSCPADGSPSESNDTTAGSNTYGAGRLYFGQAQWQNDGTIRTVCKLGFLMRGNGTGKTFTATIWTMTTINLNAVQATSDGVAGANWSSDTWVYYTFPTPFATQTSTNYALLVAPDSAMGGNDMTGYSGNTSHVGYRDMFSAAGAADQASGNDAAIKIYWQ